MKTLSDLLTRLAAPIDGPLPPANHDCCRCSRVRDQVYRVDRHWNVPQAESWLGPTGARVWSGLCTSCAALEREERIQRAVAKGESRDVAEKRYGINYELLKQREQERAQLTPVRPAVAADVDDESFGAWVSSQAARGEELERRRQEQLRAVAQLEEAHG